MVFAGIVVVVIAALGTANAHEVVIPVNTPILELARDPTEILFLNLMILVSVVPNAL
jgi:hypothetical protein